MSVIQFALALKQKMFFHNDKKRKSMFALNSKTPGFSYLKHLRKNIGDLNLNIFKLQRKQKSH